MFTRWFSSNIMSNIYKRFLFIYKVLCPKFWDSRGENMRSMDVYIEGYRITKEKKKYNDLEVKYHI